MPNARFTQQDHIRPTYCNMCHARIPSVMKETHAGLCARCATSSAKEAKEILERHHQVRDAKKEVLKLHATGFGDCPKCQSPNVSEIPKTEPNPVRGFLLWGGLAGFVAAGIGFGAFGKAQLSVSEVLSGTGAVLLVMGFAVPSRKTIAKLRACNHCAHQWQTGTETSRGACSPQIPSAAIARKS